MMIFFGGVDLAHGAPVGGEHLLGESPEGVGVDHRRLGHEIVVFERGQGGRGTREAAQERMRRIGLLFILLRIHVSVVAAPVRFH